MTTTDDRNDQEHEQRPRLHLVGQREGEGDSNAGEREELNAPLEVDGPIREAEGGEEAEDEETAGEGDGEVGEDEGPGDEEGMAAPPSPPGQGAVVLPLVQVNSTQLRKPVMQTVGAICAVNRRRDVPYVFVRGGDLVRVLRNELGDPTIEPLDEKAAMWVATGCANFVQVGGKGELKEVYPPAAVVRTVLGMGRWPDIPSLRGTVAVPTLRPDGTLLDRPGYDERTELIYDIPPGFDPPVIPEEPSDWEVRAAVDLIGTELLGDFPFMDQASTAGAWALLLTPILRPAIAGCVPLCLVDAPSPGSGKTLLCNVVAKIATGQTAGTLTAPEANEQEWRKRITAALRHGRPVVQIDNLADELRSAQLSAALTTEWWEDRELGYSRLLRLPQRATWMGTGNNIKLGGDLPRRCYMIRINPKVARPWERKESEFRHPQLLRWVQEQRAELVAALLTIVRGWIVAGRPLPPDPPAMGSFEEWSGLAAGVLAFAGVPGFLGNRAEMYERAADEANQWQAFLEALRRSWPDGRPFTVAMIAHTLTEEQDKALAEQRLLSALPESLALALASREPGFPLKLAKALGQQADRRFGPHGLRLEQTGEKQHNAVLWRVMVGE